MSQAFLNEKWADSGTMTFGCAMSCRSARASRSAWILDSVPPLVAYPPASGAVEEVAEPADQELFKGHGTGKQPGIAKVGLHEHAVRPHRNGMGDGAHGAEDVVMIEILALLSGKKSEEFFFSPTLIQHRGFSQLPGLSASPCGQLLRGFLLWHRCWLKYW